MRQNMSEVVNELVFFSLMLFLKSVTSKLLFITCFGTTIGNYLVLPVFKAY